MFTEERLHWMLRETVEPRCPDCGWYFRRPQDQPRTICRACESRRMLIVPSGVDND